MTFLYGFLADGHGPAAALSQAQSTLRDSTRAELEMRLSALHDSGRLPHATMILMLEELGKRGGPTSTPLSTSDYWAAFVFSGC
jgi:CHAT domain-containing protein